MMKYARFTGTVGEGFKPSPTMRSESSWDYNVATCRMALMDTYSPTATLAQLDMLNKIPAALMWRAFRGEI
jgi:hypothetical protein